MTNFYICAEERVYTGPLSVFAVDKTTVGHSVSLNRESIQLSMPIEVPHT